MYLNHFGLDEPPFRITPHTDFFFAGANRGATLEALLYAITHDEGIVKVSGEVGSGKTMLCRVLAERLPAHVDTILLANPSLGREEMLYAIFDELDMDVGDERQPLLLRMLQDHLIKLYGEGRRVVVLIDEAHAMPQETLEQIRLLSNLETSHSKLLQIVLFGQPELDAHLSMPDMRPLKERITAQFPPGAAAALRRGSLSRLSHARGRLPRAERVRAGSGAPDRQGLGGSDPARQHSRRQVPARGLRRQPARHHRPARRARHPRLRVPPPGREQSQDRYRRGRRGGRSGAGAGRALLVIAFGTIAGACFARLPGRAGKRRGRAS